MGYDLKVYSNFNYNAAINNKTFLKSPNQPFKKPSFIKEAKDKFSSKTKEEKKQLISKVSKYAFLAGLLTIVIIKGIKEGLSKKEITELYNKLAKEVSKETNELGIAFEKPKLIFRELKNCTGAYRESENVISFDKHMLNRRYIASNSVGSIYKNEIASKDGKTALTLLDYYRVRGKCKIPRVISKTEYRTIAEQTLAHELAHAKQTQIALSTEGAKDEIFTILKAKYGKNTTDAEFMKKLKKEAPFIFSYKPTTTLKMDEPLQSKIGIKTKLTYTPKELINSIYNYTNAETDSFLYYTNPAEIDARIAEEKTIRNIFKNFCKNRGISEEKVLELLNLVEDDEFDSLKNVLSKKDLADLEALLNMERCARHNVKVLTDYYNKK